MTETNQKPRTVRKSLIGIVAVSLAGLLLYLSLQSPKRAITHRVEDFDGVAVVEDRGWLSHYPRHVMSLPAVPLEDGIERAFLIKDMPSAQLVVKLVRESGPLPPDLILEDWSLSVRVLDGRGKIVGNADAKLSEWVLAGDYYWWHKSLRDLKFKSGDYVLKLSISGPKDEEVAIELHPVMEGGGIELP